MTVVPSSALTPCDFFSILARYYTFSIGALWLSIAKVHLPLLDYFENESHVADVLPIADSAYPIVIDTPTTIRLKNIDNIEIVKTMLCKATTAILYSSLIAKGYNSLTCG